jgi:hypothetical protein
MDPFAEENRGYVEGDDETRRRICERNDHSSRTVCGGLPFTAIQESE